MKKYKWREPKERSHLSYFSQKNYMRNYWIQRQKRKKRKNSLTSRKRNKYQTNRNCHVKQIHMVEAWYQEHGWDKNISLSQIHVWGTFNVR